MYFETGPDNTPKSTSNLVNSLTAFETDTFAADLARECFFIGKKCCKKADIARDLLSRSAAGRAKSRTDSRDVETIAKHAFRHAISWLDTVLGPLGGDPVSISSFPRKDISRKFTDVVPPVVVRAQPHERIRS